MASHFMGCGTGNVGRLEQPDGSYLTTDWVMIFFFPLVPLKSYRVISETHTLRGVPLVYASQHTTMSVQKRPMDWRHVLRVYRGLGIFAAIIIGLCVWGHYASPMPPIPGGHPHQSGRLAPAFAQPRRPGRHDAVP